MKPSPTVLLLIVLYISWTAEQTWNFQVERVEMKCTSWTFYNLSNSNTYRQWYHMYRMNFELGMFILHIWNQDLRFCSRIWDVVLWDEPNIELKCQSDVCTHNRNWNKLFDEMYGLAWWFLIQHGLPVKILLRFRLIVPAVYGT